MSDSPAPCLPISLNLDVSFGSLLGGVCLGFMFYGANCLQIFVYLVNYPKDRAALKAMVAVAWAADTVHQILGTIGVWQYLVSNYGNFVFLAGTHVPLLLALVFSAIVSTIAQLFLTHRIWQLSGRIWIFPAILAPPAVLQLALTCFYVIKGLRNNTVQSLNDLSKYTTAVNALAAGIDILITVITCTLLAQRRAGFNKSTDATLSRLIILSVNSGLWTSIFALAAAIMFCMSPLYCNTILACLNARDFVRNGIHGDEGYGPSVNPHSGSASRNGASRPIQLNVAVETKQRIDQESFDGQTLQAPSRGKQSFNEGFIEP
ncbi:hypothetical protein M405DRAFT_841488 [Rhizopogon salebrosus TDB-379]|nr:hypothetical protein M405DRAFT_841488 [Rhizopogon salebrosus TDB-379]